MSTKKQSKPIIKGPTFGKSKSETVNETTKVETTEKEDTIMETTNTTPTNTLGFDLGELKIFENIKGSSEPLVIFHEKEILINAVLKKHMADNGYSKITAAHVPAKNLLVIIPSKDESLKNIGFLLSMKSKYETMGIVVKEKMQVKADIQESNGQHYYVVTIPEELRKGE